MNMISSRRAFVQGVAAVSLASCTGGWRRGTVAPPAFAVANQSVEFGRKTLVGAGAAGLVSTGSPVVALTLGTRTVGSDHFTTSAGKPVPSAVPADAQYVWTGCVAQSDGGVLSAPFTLTINTIALRYSVKDMTEWAAVLAISVATLSGNGMLTRPGDYDWVATSHGLSGKAFTSEFIVASHDPANKGRALWRYDATSLVLQTIQNVTFEDFSAFARFNVEHHKGTNQSGIALTNTIDGLKWRRCEFSSNMQEIGASLNYKLISIDGTTDITGGSLLYEDNVFHDAWRLNNLQCGTGVISRRNEYYNYNLDCEYHAFQQGVGDGSDDGFVEDNDLHSSFCNAFTVFGGPYLDRTANYAGAADAKKMTLFVSGQVNETSATLDSYFYGEGANNYFRFNPTSSVGTHPFLTGKFEFSWKDSAGNVIIALATADYPSIDGCEFQALISVDTDGQSKMWVSVEREYDTSDDQLQSTTTAAGQLLDLTNGVARINASHDLAGDSQNAGFRRIALWHNVAVDVDDPAVRARFFVGNDVTAENIAVAAYGTPVLDGWGQKGNWSRLVGIFNNGSGGEFTKVGASNFDIGHGDMMQGAGGGLNLPGYLHSRWSFQRNRMFEARSDGNLTDFGMQGMFFEDIQAGNAYYDWTIQHNFVAVSSGHGMSFYNLQFSRMCNNTVFTKQAWIAAQGGTIQASPAIRANHHDPLGYSVVRAVNSADPATDIITTAAQSWQTTMPVIFTGGSLPGGITDGVTYYWRTISSTTGTIHTSAAGASANTGKVDVTSTGTGTARGPIARVQGNLLAGNIAFDTSSSSTVADGIPDIVRDNVDDARYDTNYDAIFNGDHVNCDSIAEAMTALAPKNGGPAMPGGAGVNDVIYGAIAAYADFDANTSESVRSGTPTAVSFVNLTSQERNTRVEFASVTIAGLGAEGAIVDVQGDGTPEIKILNAANGIIRAASVNSARVYNGEKVVINTLTGTQYDAVNTVDVLMGLDIYFLTATVEANPFLPPIIDDSFTADTVTGVWTASADDTVAWDNVNQAMLLTNGGSGFASATGPVLATVSGATYRIQLSQQLVVGTGTPQFTMSGDSPNLDLRTVSVDTTFVATGTSIQLFFTGRSSTLGHQHRLNSVKIERID